MLDLTSLLRPNDINERCGLIVNGKAVVIKNVHPEPAKGFRMDAAQLLAKAEKATATWHTHPTTDPNLSEEDYAGFMQWPSLVHHIIGVRDGTPTVESYKIVDGLVVRV